MFSKYAVMALALTGSSMAQLSLNGTNSTTSSIALSTSNPVSLSPASSSVTSTAAAVTTAAVTTAHTSSRAATSSVAVQSAAPVSPAVGARILVGGIAYQYDGCLSSGSSFSGFIAVSTNNVELTVEVCLASCSGYIYSGISGSGCYCSNSLDTNSALNQYTCNAPCPGNHAEVCGGSIANSKRQVSNALLLSLYQVVTTTTVADSAAAAAANGALTPAAGSLSVVNYVNVFLDICVGCAGGLGPVTQTTALTYAHCGCTDSAAPTPAMTVVTKTCGNGNGTVVTLTQPCPAAGTGSAVYTNGICSGSGCPAAGNAAAVCANCPSAAVTTTVTVGSACPATAAAVATAEAAATAAAAANAAAAAASAAAAAAAAAGAGSAAAAANATTEFHGAASSVKVGSIGALAGAMAVALVL